MALRASRQQGNAENQMRGLFRRQNGQAVMTDLIGCQGTVSLTFSRNNPKVCTTPEPAGRAAGLTSPPLPQLELAKPCPCSWSWLQSPGATVTPLCLLTALCLHSSMPVTHR